MNAEECKQKFINSEFTFVEIIKNRIIYKCNFCGGIIDQNINDFKPHICNNYIEHYTKYFSELMKDLKHFEFIEVFQGGSEYQIKFKYKEVERNPNPTSTKTL